MKAVVAKNKQIEFVEVDMPSIKNNECLVKVRSIGVNRADLLQIDGLYPPPQGESNILGLEFSGEVVETGDEVKNWSIGDQVFSIVASGAYSEYIAVDASHLLHKPSNLSLEEAGGVAETFITAHQALVKIAEVKTGEKVLVHAGASGVGSAAIQIAKSIGCEVFCTASAPKHEYCHELGADVCIDYKSEDFGAILKDMNMVLDLVGGNYFEKNIKVMGLEGRMVMLGFMGGVHAEQVNVAGLVTKRLSLYGSTLRARSSIYKAELISSFADHYFADGLFPFNPCIDSKFPFSRVAEAHDYMRKNRNKGKIILTTA